VVGGGGAESLEFVDLLNDTGERERHEAGGLFVLIGAEPRTEWLPDSILRDEWGYVMTGPEVQASGQWALERPPLLYETSVPGVFAVGDVRNGSVKRIASAVGEGSVVIQGIHRYLQDS
jgi:thioredoxin reductase (NADPH)